MPYAVLNKNSGTMVTASGTSATLGPGSPAATAGNVILITFGSNGGQPVATGFTRADAATNTSGFCRTYYKVATGGETSFALTQISTQATAWECREVTGLDTANLIDAAPSAFGSTAGASTMDTFTSGTNPSSTVYDGYVHVVFAAGNGGAATPAVISAHTGGLTEDTQQTATSGTTAATLSVATKATSAPAAVDYQAAVSITTTTQHSTHIVFACAGAKRAPQYDAIFGGWIGTAAGLGGVSAQTPFDSATGSPAVVNTGTDAYLELSASSAIENVAWLSASVFLLYASAVPGVVAVHVRIEFPGSLPAGDLELLNGQATGQLQVRYVAASQKIGVKVGAGTEQLSASTVAADTQYRLEFRLTSSTTAASIDWAVDGIDQTQATGVTTGGAASPLTFGWQSAQTGTVRYRDIVASRVAGQYPFGNIKIYPLLVDPAGTLTISGTTANFQTFASNGTLTAWNATTARGAIDDIPPTIGATADGIAQITTAASDYVEVPMQTRDAAANGEAIRAIRWYFPGWAASATANTIGFRGFDGTTETVLFAVADPNFDNSTTVPGWVCRMHRTLGASSGPRVITQAQLDALTARIGFSSNATVDVGVHAVLAEVAMRVDLTSRATIGDVGDITTTAAVDPDSSAVVAATVDTTATPLGATLQWTDTSGSGSHAVAAGTTFTRTFPGSADITGTTWIELDPDPDPDQPG